MVMRAVGADPCVCPETSIIILFMRGLPTSQVQGNLVNLDISLTLQSGFHSSNGCVAGMAVEHCSMKNVLGPQQIIVPFGHT